MTHREMSSPALLAELAEMLAWPTLNDGPSGDRASWTAALASSSDTERAVWLDALERPLLTATPHGARRLAAFEASPGAEWPAFPFEVTRAVTACALRFVGDQELCELAVDAIASVPEAVRDVALHETAWLGVGISSVAFTCAARINDAEPGTHHRMVLLGPSTDARIVLHELAHVWHAPRPEHGNGALTVAGEAGLRAYAAEAGFLDRLNEHERVHELLADALAEIWTRRNCC